MTAQRNLLIDPDLVSVITPCHNAAEFIGETIAAVAGQTYPIVEHIIVDDGSTDRSWEVIASYGDQVIPIRLESNLGGAGARNVGAARARGGYLLFLDADDLIAPDTIAALVESVRNRPGTLAYCGWKRLRSVGDRWIEQPAEIELPRRGEDPLREWLEGRWVPTCSLLWTRTAYEEVGGWDESLTLNDDGDIAMRALAGGAALLRATGGEGYYRAHGGERASLSASTFREDRLRSGMRVLEKLADQLRDAGRLPAYAEAIGGAYHGLALAAFQQGHTSLGREWSARAEALGSRRAVSRTALGRLLTRTLGVERKERLALGLARMGVATRRRKEALCLRPPDETAEGPIGATVEPAANPPGGSG